MCVSTAVMAGISLAASLAGTAVSVHSQAKAGRQADAAAQYNSAISNRDADLAEIKAADALAQGQKDKEDARRAYRARVGQMATQIGASNVALDSGSALDMLVDTTQIGELDALDIGAQAQRQADSYLRAAADGRNQALLSTQSGKDSLNNAMLSAGSSLLSGAASAGSQAQNLFASAGTQASKGGTFTELPSSYFPKSSIPEMPNYKINRGPNRF